MFKLLRAKNKMHDQKQKALCTCSILKMYVRSQLRNQSYLSESSATTHIVPKPDLELPKKRSVLNSLGPFFFNTLTRASATVDCVMLMFVMLLKLSPGNHVRVMYTPLNPTFI